MKTELTDEECTLLVKALDKKLWSLKHVGLPDSDPRVAPYIALRIRFLKDVHTEHCCVEHGCKYACGTDCPVEAGIKPQSHPCEQCEFDQQEQIEILAELLAKARGEKA